MKKIICAICGLTMLCGAAMAEETSVAIDLNTPIRWYTKALKWAISEIIAENGTKTEMIHGVPITTVSSAGEEMSDRLIDAIGKQSNSRDKIPLAITEASAAEIIETCMHEYSTIPDIKHKCVSLVLYAIEKHNEIAETAGFNTSGNNMAAPVISDNKIQWHTKAFLDASKLCKGTDSEMEFISSFAFMQGFGLDNMSANQIKEKCVQEAKKSDISDERANVICQDYIDNLMLLHNKYEMERLELEQIIPAIGGLEIKK